MMLGSPREGWGHTIQYYTVFLTTEKNNWMMVAESRYEY